MKFPAKNSMGSYVYLPQKWSQGAPKIACLKYYNVLEWESRFTLGLNAAKNTDYIKKCFE